MSGMLAVTTPDRGYLLADAAVYDRTGVLTDIRSKTVVLPQLMAAGSCRGNLLPLLMMTEAGKNFACWDEFRPCAPAVFAAIDNTMKMAIPGRLYEFMMVGWSDERDRAEVIFHATHDEFPTAYNRGGPTLITDAMIPRGQGLARALRVDRLSFDPITHGVPAFDYARATTADLTCGQEAEPIIGYSIGGFLQCVTIGRNEIRSDLLKEWPDEVGRKIQPTQELGDA